MHSHPAGNPAAALGMALQRTRRQLCRQIDNLAAQPDAAFLAGWNHLVAEAEAAFRHEESVMELAHYAGLAAHRAENARTLGALHHVTPRVDGGDSGIGRAVLAALAAIVASHRYSASVAPGDPLLHRHRTPGRDA